MEPEKVHVRTYVVVHWFRRTSTEVVHSSTCTMYNVNVVYISVFTIRESNRAQVQKCTKRYTWAHVNRFTGVQGTLVVHVNRWFMYL